ncbi:MAG: hypothetical protein ACON5O_09160 [Lentimonas sp.]
MHWTLLVLILIALSTLTAWSWQKWSASWIEPSTSFFPPEFENEDLDKLAAKYPIYRSNDTYQWVYLAASVSDGDSSVLKHRKNEGPPAEGRENAWNSGLVYLLNLSGAIDAKINDYSIERGIYRSAHYLGSILLLITIGTGIFLVSRLEGPVTGAIFGALYFFNAAISWDFAFSRLDHESMFQFFLLLQILGVIGMMRKAENKKGLWTVLAGVGTAGCWWVSSTVQVAVSVFIMLGCLASSLSKDGDQSKAAPALIGWGCISSVGIVVACIFEGRSPLEPSLSALHPLFAITQLGACMVCAAAVLSERKSKRILFGLGLIAGLSPLMWMGIYQESAHTWFDPVIRRVHNHIVEFQSPFANGSWGTSLFAQSTLAVMVLIILQPWKRRGGALCLIVGILLLILGLLQSRWLGMVASVSTIGICLSIQQRNYLKYCAVVFAVVLTIFWAIHWNRIQTKPGLQFVTDMFLQVGARDLNLCLDRIEEGQKTNVAIPYAFSASSAMHEAVHPLGTLYWENRDGIYNTAQIFAAQNDDTALELIRAHGIHYLAVQPNELGGPFIEMVTWTALGSDESATLRKSLAWRLSYDRGVPDWCEPIPFYGTFDPTRFSMRIYKVKE